MVQPNVDMSLTNSRSISDFFFAVMLLIPVSQSVVLISQAKIFPDEIACKSLLLLENRSKKDKSELKDKGVIRGNNET